VSETDQPFNASEFLKFRRSQNTPMEKELTREEIQKLIRDAFMEGYNEGLSGGHPMSRPRPEAAWEESYSKDAYDEIRATRASEPNPLERLAELHDPNVSDEEFAKQVEDFSKGQKPSIFVPTLSEDGKRIVSYTVTPGEGIPPGTKCGLGVTFGENSEMPTDTAKGEE